MENKEFFLKCDGIKLHAKMEFPSEKKEKYPCVIVVHGLTGHMEEDHIKAVAAACNSVGYMSLRVEMYGHGQSEGEFRNHTVAHWVLELMQVIDYVRSLDYVSKIYLMGHSQGGATVVLTAGLKEECLEAIIPLSPAMLIKEIPVLGEFPNEVSAPSDNKDEVLLFGKHRLSTNYHKACKMLPFEAAVKGFNKKVLIVHGDDDELVPYRYAVELQKEYKNATLVTIKGDDHCFTRHLEEVTKAVREFLLSEK